MYQRLFHFLIAPWCQVIVSLTAATGLLTFLSIWNRTSQRKWTDPQTLRKARISRRGDVPDPPDIALSLIECVLKTGIPQAVVLADGAMVATESS